MSEFHDPELRQQLGRLSGPYPDDNVAFEQWQRRVGQARRRRAVAWTTGVALSLLVGAVAVAALQNPAQHSLVPSNSSKSSEEFIVTVPMTDGDESSTIESTVPVPLPVTSAPSTLAPDTTPSSEVEPESSPPESEGPAAAGQPSSGGSTTSHESPSTSVEAIEPQTITQTFDSDGGSVTVRQEGGRLQVVATSPAAGFRTGENDVSGRRVDVTFTSADHLYQITVRLLEGVMKPTTSERSDAPHEDSAPPPVDTTGNDHGGGGDD